MAGRLVSILPPPTWAVGGGLFMAGWLLDRWLIGAGAWGGLAVTDTPVYFNFASKMLAGRLPYRDFPVEYPPFALPAFLAPALLPAARHDPVVYAVAFAALMAMLGTVLAILAVRTSEALGRTRRETLVVAAAVAATPALLGMLAPMHFDLWPATLLSAALFLHLGRHRRASAILLGLAAAAKVYPVVLAPLLALDILRSEGRRSLVSWSMAFAGAAVAPYIPFALWGPGPVLHGLFAQIERPLQVESLGAALLLGGHWASGLPVTVVSSFGSQNLVGELPDLVRQELHLLAVIGLAGTWTWYARVGGGAGQLARAAALAIAVTVATDSTLSPQYMLWLVPVVFLVPGRRGAAATAVAMAAFLLTSAYFPARYFDLVQLRSAGPVWILLARDLALVALVGVLAVPAAPAQPGPVVPEIQGA